MKLPSLLLVVALGSETWVPDSREVLEVFSSDGRFVAEVRAPFQGQRRRWTLAVRETGDPGRHEVLWSAPYRPDPDASTHWLSTDGSVFVSLQHRYRESSPLLRVLQDRRDPVSLYASDFGFRFGELARGPEGRVWILPEDEPFDTGWIETLRGPVYGFGLLCSDGAWRVVDVDAGEVLREDELPPTQPWVEPSLRAHGQLDSLFVNEVWLPVATEVGGPAVGEIRGLPPTLAWTLEGYELFQEPSSRLHIKPWGQRFVSDQGYHPAPQSCEFTFELGGLASGRYQVRVHGLEGSEAVYDEDLVVLPATSSVYLSIYGGPDGIERDVTLFPTGIVKLDWLSHSRTEYRVLSPDALERIVALVDQLPTDSLPHWTEDGTPVRSYQLIFRTRDGFAHIGADEGTVEGPTATLVAILSGLFDG